MNRFAVDLTFPIICDIMSCNKEFQFCSFINWCGQGLMDVRHTYLQVQYNLSASFLECIVMGEI